MKNDFLQAIHRMNKKAKQEPNQVARARLYALKEAYLWSLRQSGDLVYLGSHFRFIPVKDSPTNRLQVLHYYRSGSFSFHLNHLFSGMKLRLIGEFKLNRAAESRS